MAHSVLTSYPSFRHASIKEGPCSRSRPARRPRAVAGGLSAHLVVFPARSFSECLSRPGSPRRLVDGEEIRESRPPGYNELG